MQPKNSKNDKQQPVCIQEDAGELVPKTSVNRI